jgi:hypothetical protein
MSETFALSESAVAVLRFRVKGYRMKITDSSLEAFRELAAAGINHPVSTWAGGPESVFRFTRAGWERREQWINAFADALHP